MMKRIVILFVLIGGICFGLNYFGVELPELPILSSVSHSQIPRVGAKKTVRVSADAVPQSGRRGRSGATSFG